MASLEDDFLFLRRRLVKPVHQFLRLQIFQDVAPALDASADAIKECLILPDELAGDVKLGRLRF